MTYRATVMRIPLVIVISALTKSIDSPRALSAVTLSVVIHNVRVVIFPLQIPHAERNTFGVWFTYDMTQHIVNQWFWRPFPAIRYVENIENTKQSHSFVSPVMPTQPLGCIPYMHRVYTPKLKYGELSDGAMDSDGNSIDNILPLLTPEPFKLTATLATYTHDDHGIFNRYMISTVPRI